MIRDESGFTLTELLAGIAAFGVVLGAILTMTTVATHNQDRIAKRVAANQRARPVLTRIVNHLHSACVAPRVAPVQANSSNTSISFVSKAGRDVTPVPDLRVLTLSGTTLSESLFPATGGAQPVWTFSPTAYPGYPRTMLTNVAAPGGVMFRYFQFINGQPSATPLPTPLTATDAARTGMVSVSLTPGLGGSPSANPDYPITLSDTVTFRLEPSRPTQENPPCV